MVVCLTWDQGVEDSRYIGGTVRGRLSLIPARSHTFMMIYHEIISTVILFPSADLRRVFVSYMRKYMCTKYWLTALSQACP